jgi:hypothetical protein
LPALSAIDSSAALMMTGAIFEPLGTPRTRSVPEPAAGVIAIDNWCATQSRWRAISTDFAPPSRL